MESVKLGALSVSRVILGSNQYSGFSHQDIIRDKEMKIYYSTARIKQSLHQAEELGLTTLIGRVDEHILRTLLEYWEEGGKLKWIAHTIAGAGSTDNLVQKAIQGGASAIVIHGGVMDHAYSLRSFGDPKKGIKIAKDAGLPIGIAGHNPAIFSWAEENLDVDFYMCSYYNSAHRDLSPEKSANQHEWFIDEDRNIMASMIQTLKKPVIHFKVFAAGRNEPHSALEFAAKTMRLSDAICVGIFEKNNQNMLKEDLSYFENAWKLVRF
jgi:hypothetical protein